MLHPHQAILATHSLNGFEVHHPEDYNVPTYQGNNMQTVNIRQLKTNPSTALRSAKENDMVVVMNRDHPEALLVDLEKLDFPDLAAVRVALAVSLFRSGVVSAGFAARMTNKTLPEMLTLFSSLGIPLTNGNESDARDDLNAGKQWLAKKR